MNTRDHPDVRPARTHDFDTVADVWFESASKMDGPVAEMPSREELRRRIDREIAGGWLLHVALLDGQIAGMLALKPSDATLDQLFIRPSDQGRGAGGRC